MQPADGAKNECPQMWKERRRQAGGQPAGAWPPLPRQPARWAPFAQPSLPARWETYTWESTSGLRRADSRWVGGQAGAGDCPTLSLTLAVPALPPPCQLGSLPVSGSGQAQDSCPLHMVLTEETGSLLHSWGGEKSFGDLVPTSQEAGRRLAEGDRSLSTHPTGWRGGGLAPEGVCSTRWISPALGPLEPVSAPQKGPGLVLKFVAPSKGSAV